MAAVDDGNASCKNQHSGNAPGHNRIDSSGVSEAVDKRVLDCCGCFPIIGKEIC